MGYQKVFTGGKNTKRAGEAETRCGSGKRVQSGGVRPRGLKRGHRRREENHAWQKKTKRDMKNEMQCETR